VWAGAGARGASYQAGWGVPPLHATDTERRKVDIGTEDAPYVIEPIVEPIPNKTPEPAPVEPAPVKEPKREREKVPA
jgi:hypothetical protein